MRELGRQHGGRSGTTRHSRLLVLDLDGTLLGDPAATRRFASLLESRRSSLVLAYVTGRTWVETRSVLASPAVPQPDFVATYSGSALYAAGPDWHLDPDWHRRLETGWSAARVRSIAACLPYLKIQDEAAQHPLRCSYRVLARDVQPVVASLTTALSRQRVRARVLASSGGCIDVVPLQGGKGNVVRHLMQRLAVQSHDVVVCGNDGSDLDMLRLEVAAIAVGNMADVWRRQLPSHVYQARASYADGIAEGLSHWGWLQAAPVLTAM
jgi:sucrose-6F-phosphate phosphohydrolase